MGVTPTLLKARTGLCTPPGETSAARSKYSLWSAPAERSDDGALDVLVLLTSCKRWRAKAVSPLRSATTLQIQFALKSVPSASADGLRMQLKVPFCPTCLRRWY